VGVSEDFSDGQIYFMGCILPLRDLESMRWGIGEILGAGNREKKLSSSSNHHRLYTLEV